MAFLGLSGSDQDQRLAYMNAILGQQNNTNAALQAQAAAAAARSAVPTAAPASAPIAAAEAPPPPDIEGYLSSRFSSLPYDSTVQGDIGSRFRQSVGANPSLSLADAFASAAGGAETDATTRRLASINSMYAPGYENTALPTTAYQPTVQALHDEMLGSAKTAIDAASKRGQLNQAGLNAANTSLGTADAGALSRLNDIGNSVLSKYRGNVASAITNMQNEARTTPWYQAYDPTQHNQGVTDAINAGTTGLAGDIRTAVGGSNFFDPSTLLGQATTSQGAVNQGKPALGPAPTSSGSTDTEYKKRAQTNVGVF